MDTRLGNYPALQIRLDKLLAFVQEMIGGAGERPSDDQPLPPGPWDPVIRTALRRIDVLGTPAGSWQEFVLGVLARRRPEVYDAPRGGGQGFYDKVALNPQPLPPRYAFLESLAYAVVERAELLNEMAAAFSDESEQRGIIVVGGYISRFIDEFCGTGYRPSFPFPGPRPRWFPEGFNGIDLLVLATHFDQAAQEAYSPVLRENLTEASAKLLDAAVSRLQE